MPHPRRWDIFCKVVDNYGDAGVAWRLARQLAAEHALEVTLWLDELAPLSRIAPGVTRGCARQEVAGVTLCHWVEPFAAGNAGELADVVVEAFGCGLPENYVAAMARRRPPPAWVILEYLSAEAWVDGTHGRASPHPRLPLPRQYWFPGFTADTGGLLRERGLLAARDAFRSDADAQQRFWHSLGFALPDPDEIRVSLFCYPNPMLAALFDGWADGNAPVTCIVPEGVAAGALDQWTGGNVPHAGAPFRRGRLSIRTIPFLSQDDYDRLLWLCACNFVRGEDSFVRAQWAARPFVWHIYPQAEGAHWRKLDAFLDRYAAGLDRPAAGALTRFWRTWNGAGDARPPDAGPPDAGPIGASWLEFAAARPHLQRHADAWAAALASGPDLATGLVRWAMNQV